MTFRPMSRPKQQLDMQQCVEVLKTQPRGVLCVQGDDGYPYGLPMDHYYREQDGVIVFHSGKQGHKVDALLRCDKVSFCVYDEGWREEGEWALNIRSVIVFGRVRFVDDPARAVALTRELSYKYTQDADYIEGEIRKYADGLMCFELIPEHISGKLVKEN